VTTIHLQYKDADLTEMYNQIKFKQLLNKVRILKINVSTLIVFTTAREMVHYDE